jgi:hypothetical protein
VIDLQPRGAAHALPRLSFEEEARRTYGITLDAAERLEFGAARPPSASASAGETASARPVFEESASDNEWIDAALDALDRKLPRVGDATVPESLAGRFDAYRRRFAVPADRRRAVFEAALDACRARTVAHWALPPGERIDVKWDIAAPGAWHRYEGHGRSTKATRAIMRSSCWPISRRGSRTRWRCCARR